MGFYENMQEVADRLINKYGVSASHFSVSQTPDDPGKPWEGRENEETELPIVACKLPLSSGDVKYFGVDAVVTASAKILVSCKDLQASLVVNDRIEIAGEKFTIVAYKLINPTITPKVLYSVLVKQ